MPQCEFREKPGAFEVCPRQADAGEKFCPRHKAIEAARSAEQDARIRARELQARLDRKVETKLPETRRGLIEQGYQYTGNDVCVCGHPIEWWRTPNQRRAPYEPMRDAAATATSHYAYCKRAFEKQTRRRAA